MVDMALSEDERRVAAEAGIVLFDDRLILDAQPPIDDATLVAVAERCAGPLPEPLVALWRTTFGGRLDYDVQVDWGGHEESLSVRELFHPDSGGYHDLWGWIGHEEELLREARPDRSGGLDALPFGGFEYLDRVYVRTAPGPEYGAVVAWRQGLPPGWELNCGDRAANVAGNLHDLFDRLVLEQDPWSDDATSGSDLVEAIDGLADSSDPAARSASEHLRRLVRATVLDWRAALEQGGLGSQRRLRHLALDHAASTDDVELLARIVEQGGDPAEAVRNGLTPLDVALVSRSWTVVRRLLDHRVPVRQALRFGGSTVDLDLARELVHRGAERNESALLSAADNDDEAVLVLVAESVPPSAGLVQLGRRLWQTAARAAHAARRASARGDAEAAVRNERRAAVLNELAARYAPDGPPRFTFSGDR
jgi:hypothetical protein